MNQFSPLQDHVHRGAAEDAKVDCFVLSGERPESTKVQLAIKFQKNHVPSRKMVFYLAASHRQMKTSLLFGLCVFAVRIQFGLISC